MSASDTQDDAGPGSMRWIGVADAAALRQVAYRRILDAAARAIERRGRFLIVLAGGNTPRGIYRMLRTADTDWSRWQVYFGDERCLPADSAERNSRMAADAWLNHVPIPQDQVHAIPAELGASAAALGYAETLRGVGDFDLVLLGLGEDGHTASLFPGRDWGVAAERTGCAGRLRCAEAAAATRVAQRGALEPHARNTVSSRRRSQAQSSHTLARRRAVASGYDPARGRHRCSG